MAKKDEKLTLDEENEQKAKFAGMLQRDVITADEAIGTQKKKSSELSGTLGGVMTNFEKKGGHKKAMKLASQCADMEPADFADFFRSFIGYGRALGIFDENGKPSQMDMLDQDEENQKNADSISAANVAARSTAKPSMGSEPRIN